MKVIPAVDILNGYCVQLVQGKRETATRYGRPIDCAVKWRDLGADTLHVVNLDGAFGSSGANAEFIYEIVQTTAMRIELGGGIRSFEDAAGWLRLGVERVILGTAVVRDPRLIHQIARDFGKDRVMAGVDARSGMIAVEGWEKTRGDYIVWARRFEEEGAGYLLYTNIDVEGLQQGISVQSAASLITSVRVPVVVAGGITTLQDVRELKRIGAYGVVLGSALYAGKIDLQEAQEAAHEIC